MADTRLQDIYKQLQADNIDVYFAGQATGDVLSPRTVIKYAGGSQVGVFTTIQDLYDIMMYVPKDSYSQIESYKKTVKASMRKLYPMIGDAHVETPSYYDETVKGHMVSSEYYNYKKMER